VLALRLPVVTVGYCLSILCSVAEVSHPSFNVAGAIQISQEPQAIRCCLGSPSKGG